MRERLGHAAKRPVQFAFGMGDRDPPRYLLRTSSRIMPSTACAARSRHPGSIVFASGAANSWRSKTLTDRPRKPHGGQPPSRAVTSRTMPVTTNIQAVDARAPALQAHRCQRQSAGPFAGPRAATRHKIGWGALVFRSPVIEFTDAKAHWQH
jgi:hypothetical protein